MKAEILCIGDELLIGQVVNTNATEIAQQLEAIGIEVWRIVSVGDKKAMIQAELRNALAEVELVIITGGLGPTHDDVTKVAVAECFGLGMEWNEAAYQNCKRLFERRGVRMPDINRSQAEVIAGSLVVQNSHGTAPGMILNNLKGYEGKVVILMPGVPYEMNAMMKESIIPFLAPLSDSFVRHSVIATAGIGESHLAELVGNEQEFLTPNSTLAYLPHTWACDCALHTRQNRETF
jgi:molybdenum cofactor synthesis domain